MSTETSTTAETTTFPRPDDGGCPTWCHRAVRGHPWTQDYDGTWSRLHVQNVGMFSVNQPENVMADGRTFDAPSGDTCLDTFGTAQDGRDLAAGLETVARLMDQIEAAR